jgi:type I restriction enzyme, S subunit
MEEWKTYKLSEVATLTTGFPFNGSKYSKEGQRVVRGDNVTIGSLRWEGVDKDKRWNEPFGKAAEYSLHSEDIIVGMDGSRVGMNRVKIKAEELPLYLAQRVACIRHNVKSTQSFLYYQIFSDRFVNYIKAVQTGTSIPHISLKQLGNYPIFLPSVLLQEKISSILSSLDDKIELNNRINHNLKLSQYYLTIQSAA